MMGSREASAPKIDGGFGQARKFEWIFAAAAILVVAYLLAPKSLWEGSRSPTVEEVKASVAGWTEEISDPTTGSVEKRIHYPGGRLEVLSDGKSTEGSWRVTRDSLLCQVTSAGQSCYELVKVGNEIHFRTRGGAPARTAFPIKK